MTAGTAENRCRAHACQWPARSILAIGSPRGTAARARTFRQEGDIVEIVIGLVFYAIIWTVVIFGSEYMNRNVQ
jgi:hypothetical protein